MNKVILIGRLTKDPELRYAAGSGTAVCRFTVAINRQFKKWNRLYKLCSIWKNWRNNYTIPYKG